MALEDQIIRVYAPVKAERPGPYNRRPVILSEHHPLHPANPEFGLDEEFVHICEGDGLAGATRTVWVDDHDHEKGTEEIELPEGIRVFAGSKGVRKCISEGTLVEIMEGRPVPEVDEVDEESLASIGIGERAQKALKDHAIRSRSDLVAAIKKGFDLEDVEGIGAHTKGAILDRLEKDGDLPPREGR